MKIAIGCDHAAVEYKDLIKEYLLSKNCEIIDTGIEKGEKADYPDMAEKVSLLVSHGEAEYGILLCGTGVGMSIAANKVKGIRAAVIDNLFTAKLSRSHNDLNILCLGQRVIGAELAIEIVDTFLNTPAEPGRHAARVNKITDLENRNQ